MRWSGHDLSVSRLNDHAAAFGPSTFTLERCELLVEHPALLVLGLPLRDIFLMKLGRAEPADDHLAEFVVAELAKGGIEVPLE